jgi:hypothetical protein
MLLHLDYLHSSMLSAQPEDGEYPGREFNETPMESASAAPTMSRTSMKHPNAEDVDRVEDSKELGAHTPSSGDEDDAAILVKPLDSHPPPRTGKNPFRALASIHRKIPCRTFFLNNFDSF